MRANCGGNGYKCVVKSFLNQAAKRKHQYHLSKMYSAAKAAYQRRSGALASEKSRIATPGSISLATQRRKQAAARPAEKIKSAAALKTAAASARFGGKQRQNTGAALALATALIHKQ